MGKKVHVDLGVNAAFMTRRYEEPESWARIIRGLGFDYVSFDSDALDWFYSGDRDYILRTAKETRGIFENAGLKIVDYLTGVAPYRFFGLAHKDPEARAQMYRWMEGAIEIAAALGAESVSGRFDAFSVEVQAKPEAFGARYGELMRQYRALALQAKKRGLSAIGIEQMYVPSLIPYTIAGTKKYFADANEGNEEGAVIRPVVDTGHACGQNYGVSGDDLFYEKWLEEFGVLGNTIKNNVKTILTICSVLATARIMVHSGMTRDVADVLVLITGNFYPLFAPLVGVLGAFVTGSGTSTGILFGSLQSAAATQIGAAPGWLCAANSFGAGVGKMIAPSNVALACASAGLAGNESKIMSQSIKWVVAFVILGGIITFVGPMIGIVVM